MKSVLAFGDSLTWGYIPGTRGRYGRDVRWPKVLEARLKDVEVIENGLNARTTVHGNPFRDYRKGIDILPSLLESHAPLDLVIIMLGSNDAHSNLGLGAIDIQRGMRRLVQFVRSYETEPNMPIPQVLVIAPPKLNDTDDDYFRHLFGNARDYFSQIAPLYRQMAEEEGVHFFDAGSVAQASTIDGVHLSAENTRNIGEALVAPVQTILNL